MHAIICQPDGHRYLSAVFGYYYQEYQREDGLLCYHDYWIVWDAEQTRLMRWPTFQKGTEYLVKQVLVVDADQSDWQLTEDGQGCVNFWQRDQWDALTTQATPDPALLERCRKLDEGYVYDPMPEIKTQQDIENLNWAVNNFHDGYIVKEQLQADGKLYLKFAGLWGCQLEVWFWGDLEYDTSSVQDNPYWFGSTTLLADGFVYLVDDEYMTVAKITSDYCYFKARHMQYHLIPQEGS